MERDLAALEQGAHADSERLAALVALVEAHAGRLALHLADALKAAAMRADWTVRPHSRLNVGKCLFFVVKVWV